MTEQHELVIKTGVVLPTASIMQRLPLLVLLEEKKHILRGVSARDVYDAYVRFHDRQPERDQRNRCLYNTTDLAVILASTVSPDRDLKELENWKRLLPLAPSLTRKQAIARLANVGKPGWLLRSRYQRGELLLVEEDAEQLCYLRKVPGYGEQPIRWSAPVVGGEGQ